MIPSAQVLIVEDDEKIRHIIRDVLELENIRVFEAGNCSDAEHFVINTHLDLVLLDLGLPDIDGITFANIVKQRKDVPIIMLTGRSDVVDKVVGLENGADDYITKPFHSMELVARVRTVLRRKTENNPQLNFNSFSDEVAEFCGWQLNLLTSKLTSSNGTEVFLTAYEFKILFALVSKPNTIISRDQIAKILNSRPQKAYGRNIDVLIGKLRKKLNDDHSKPIFIKTLRNLGYIFIAPVKMKKPVT